MQPGHSLSFAAPTFNVKLCTGVEKNFHSCTTWELLNLTPTEVAAIPGRLYKRFGISSDTLGKQLEPYSIQTVGKGYLDEIFRIGKAPQYLVSVANHYSWPKGCAITGIGRENLILLDVDEDGRMDPKGLEQKLLDRLEEQRAVYCVVVLVGEHRICSPLEHHLTQQYRILGTTEYGGVDNLEEVLAIRERMELKGMSFMIHADAAWGGYFATKAKPQLRMPKEEYAFSIPLNEWTLNQLFRLHQVE